MTIANTVLRTIRRHALLADGSLLVVGVSGGADSLALLHLLVQHQAAIGCRLHVATLDHGLRGQDGADDAQFVVEMAQAWKLDVTSGTADVRVLASEQGIGIETAARLARYDFLAQVAVRIGAERVAVAHHADDQAETVLMHLLRGAGIEGLGGMGYEAPLPHHPQLKLIRPLLDVSRAEIEAYSEAHHLNPRHDATNNDTAYIRNRLRHEVLPDLQTHYPQVMRSLVQLADVATIENSFVEGEFKSRILPHVSEAPGCVQLDRTVFMKAHSSLQRRFVRWAAGQLGVTDDLAYGHIVAAVEIMLSGRLGAVAELPDGVQVRLDYESIVVERVGSAHPINETFLLLYDQEIDVPVPGHVEFADGWVLHVEHADTLAGLPESARMQLRMSINEGAKVVLRTRREGDQVVLLSNTGVRHTQKLTKWMINAKVPKAIRDQIPLLTVNTEIVAILWEKALWSFKLYNVRTGSLESVLVWFVNTNQ